MTSGPCPFACFIREIERYYFVWLDVTLSILLFRLKPFSGIAEASNFFNYFGYKAKV